MLKDVYDDDGLDDIHHHDNDYYYYYNDGLKVLAVNQIIIIHYNDDVDVHDVYDGHDVKNYLYDDVIQILMIYPMRNVMLILYLKIICVIIIVVCLNQSEINTKKKRERKINKKNVRNQKTKICTTQ